MVKLTREEKEQHTARWPVENKKAIELFHHLTKIVQAVEPKFPGFELNGFSYGAPSSHKPIPSVTFRPTRGTRSIGINGSDSDLDGRFYIHAYATQNVEIYIFEHARSKKLGLKCLTLEQERELKLLLDAVVAEQAERRREK